MRFKKAVSLLLVICMIGLLGGCKNSKSDPTSNTEPTKEPVTEKVTEAPVDANTPTPAEEAASDYADEMLITVFDVAANYEGDQIGWYGKILKDKFNIKLNIISPQVAGDQIYQTRASAGELGDIVLLERSDFADCIDNNLVRDITDSISNYPNLMKFKEQIDVYNNGIPNNTSKLTYGIPVQMTNSSPTSFSQDVIYSSPMLRWDQYSELGCPDIADLDGLIDVLAQIQKKHPTNPDGDPAYALSLWPDWDNGDDMMGIANVVQLTTWYGDKLKDSAVLKPDGTFTRATDKTAGYYKMLQFLNHAYQRGIVDPDSGT
ncbi:MAG: sugar ABC transporter substrate-binding protein, partial [Clostridiales bacterium]|nr:sugar ABC transporter substrate-binding protein [Clostridiales bacterium]